VKITRRHRLAFAGLALLATGCRGEAPVTVPAFAGQLPGHTVLVLWSEPGAIDADLQAAMLELARTARLEAVATPPPGVLAFAASEAIEVGWRSLAESREFRDACANPGPGSVHLYADLQLLGETVLRAHEGMPGPFGREVASRALNLWRQTGIRALRAGIDVDGRQVRARGRILGHDSQLGTVAVLHAAPPLLRAPPADPAALVQLETACNPQAFVHWFDLMTSATGGDLLQTMASQLTPELRERVRSALRCLDGRVSVHASARGSAAAFGVADATTLARVLKEALPAAGDGFDLGKARVRLTGNSLLWLWPERTKPPVAWQEQRQPPPAALKLWLAAQAPLVGRLTLQFSEIDAATVGFEGELWR
jgi:hypothetical protein